MVRSSTRRQQYLELMDQGWQMQGSSEVIYLTHTRPDLAYAVGLVSRFMHCPSKQHYGAAKRILRYIAGTTTYGIWYVRKEKFELVGYCDSDWAGAKDDMKSASGNCFMFGSGVVTWEGTSYCRLIFNRVYLCSNSSLPSCVDKESVGRLESDTR
ncbi:hypothetical protein Tco_0878866 [Tanacetum coccineum]|uniref:Mitochondrial protein n=1 Tax=Tanacetum coccineum TaxID=301880 RepID=A0ABQ5BZ41_9ASTR